MRLSTNEIVSRAKKFAHGWANASYEKGETQTFYNEFFEIFGVTRRHVARYEEPVKKLDDEAASSTCSGRGCCSSNRRARDAT